LSNAITLIYKRWRTGKRVGRAKRKRIPRKVLSAGPRVFVCIGREGGVGRGADGGGESE
jgi:hypothetical protein